MAYVLEDQNLLFCRHPKRGWGLPGGHREAGETIMQAIEREVAEEACVTIKDIRPIGHIRIECLGPKPENYPYPYPTRFVQIVSAQIDKIMDFVPFEDSLERKFVPANIINEKELAHRDELFWLPYAVPQK